MVLPRDPSHAHWELLGVQKGRRGVLRVLALDVGHFGVVEHVKVPDLTVLPGLPAGIVAVGAHPGMAGEGLLTLVD